MFIIFGTRGIKHAVSDSEILNDSCPNCDKGNLVNKLYRRWFTLFFIPVIPLDVIDRFYECDSCKSGYNEKIKDVLKSNMDTLEENKIHYKRIYAKAVVAAMTHMAVIDGDFAKEEEREIRDIISAFEEFQDELWTVFQEVKTHQNRDNQVFNYLNDARTELSSEALLNILAQAGIILLADGNIEKEEEQLMKDYLIACGLPKDLYSELIHKLQEKDMSQLKEGQLN